MNIRSTLKYKLLHLVFIQASFFILMLAALWLINPSWMLAPTQIQEPSSATIKAIKHHYGMLNTLNLSLANYYQKQEFSAEEFNALMSQFREHSQAIKARSQTAQQEFKIDFSVLVSFLFNYETKLKNLNPGTTQFDERLWQLQQFYTRIQSELFYIFEEVDSAEVEAMTTALKNARTSLYLWAIVSFLTLILSTLFALNQAAKWKEQIADLLKKIYRVNAGDYSNADQTKITSDDEIGYLAKTLSETMELLNKQKKI